MPDGHDHRRALPRPCLRTLVPVLRDGGRAARLRRRARRQSASSVLRWPIARRCRSSSAPARAGHTSAISLAALRPDAQALGVGDRHRRRQRRGSCRAAWTVSVRTRSGSRARALRFRAVRGRSAPARGEVVATTEDHAMPRPGLVRGDRSRARCAIREAAAIGGAIENGSTDGLIEWASYFTTQGPHMAPLGDRVVRYDDQRGERLVQALASSTEYDANGRARLHGHPVQPTPGRARRGPARRRPRWSSTTSRPRVSAPTTSIHFHNGRTISGFRRERGMAARIGCAWPRALMLPAWRMLRVVRIGLAKGRLRRRAAGQRTRWRCGSSTYRARATWRATCSAPGDSPSHLR